MESRKISLISLTIISILIILGLLLFAEELSDITTGQKITLLIIFYIPLLLGMEVTWKEYHFYHKYNAVISLIYIILSFWIILQSYSRPEYSKITTSLGIILGIISFYLAKHSFSKS